MVAQSKKTKQGTDQARLMSAGILVDNRKILPIMLIILVLLVVTSIATLAYMLTRFQQYDAKLKAVGEITAPFKGEFVAMSHVSTFYSRILLHQMPDFIKL